MMCIYCSATVHEEWKTFFFETHQDGEDKGSNSKWQATAQHGEDGVAQVVIDGVS